MNIAHFIYSIFFGGIVMFVALLLVAYYLHRNEKK